MIVVKKAETLSDYKKFVNFPFELYKNSKYWVPPISKEELNTMDKSNQLSANQLCTLPALVHRNSLELHRRYLHYKKA